MELPKLRSLSPESYSAAILYSCYMYMYVHYLSPTLTHIIIVNVAVVVETLGVKSVAAVVCVPEIKTAGEVP